jgi:hypothetical protein
MLPGGIADKDSEDKNIRDLRSGEPSRALQPSGLIPARFDFHLPGTATAPEEPLVFPAPGVIPGDFVAMTLPLTGDLSWR